MWSASSGEYADESARSVGFSEEAELGGSIDGSFGIDATGELAAGLGFLVGGNAKAKANLGVTISLTASQGLDLSERSELSSAVDGESFLKRALTVDPREAFETEAMASAEYEDAKITLGSGTSIRMTARLSCNVCGTTGSR